MKKTKLRPIQIVFCILTFAVMCLIFWFSCENADDSSRTSGGITEFVSEHFVKGYHEMSVSQKLNSLNFVSHIVRKTAHFTIYTTLGFFASCAVWKRKLISDKSLYVLIFCVAYAASDEIHQIFVPGRAGMVRDVLLDSSGSITGILISFIFFMLLRKRTKQ